MKSFYDTFETAFGPFSVAVDATGAVIATAFGGLAELRHRFDGEDLQEDRPRISTIRAEILEYFAGTRQRFSVRLAPTGTLFQKKVWSALQRVPYGATVSYGELATRMNKAGSARAVGRANATNPVCLIVPCHRVIGSDGSLTGYAFGERIKQQLIAHEVAVVQRASAA